jgi:hypothetical protein
VGWFCVQDCTALFNIVQLTKKNCILACGDIIAGMRNLTIKTETLAARCEVCHQSDCFDAENNYCARCADIASRIFFASEKAVHHLTRRMLVKSERKIVIELIICVSTLLAWPISKLGLRRARLMERIQQGRPLNTPSAEIEQICID